jgi:CTP synthase
MTLTLVTHSDCCPALFGALAASVAHVDNAMLMHLAAQFTQANGADAVQMVAAKGELVPSGLLWYERLTGREVLPASTVAEIIATAANGNVVVPWHPEFQSDALRVQLLEQAHKAGIVVTHLTGRSQDNAWCLETPNGEPTDYGLWRRDGFGRWVSQHPDTDQATDTVTDPATDQRTPALIIALIGAKSDQTDVYPATLAALGDAADATDITVRVRFVSPLQLNTSVLEGVDGILLPGGSDMINVPGQIETARHGLQSGIPTLGLCLGMQSMSTAFAQSLPGLEQANMAEAAPHAPIKSFLPMAGTPGLPDYRLGTQQLRFDDPVVEQRFKDHPTVRCNHRYILNPTLIAPMRAAGFALIATDASAQIADAIDWPQHRFYKGMQGHPEITSRATDAHPLLEDFLLAALAGLKTKNSTASRPETLHTMTN